MNPYLPIPDFMRDKAADLFADLLSLSCMWLLCCLPIITIPTATIALYDTVARCIVGGKKEPVKHFWRTVKNELIRGILLGIELLVFAAISFASFSFLSSLAEQMPLFQIYRWVYLATMVIPLGLVVWMLPVESRFGYGYWELHKAAAIFALSKPLPTLIMAAVLIAICVVFLIFPIATISLLILPGVLTLIQTGTVEPAFAPYMDEN